MKQIFVIIALSAVLAVLAGCGASENAAELLTDIPVYPNAEQSDALQGESPMGMVGGKLLQYTTSDSFDDVVKFYEEKMAAHNPQVMSNETEFGRMTALTVESGNSVVNVTIQKPNQDNSVTITHMAVSK